MSDCQTVNGVSMVINLSNEVKLVGGVTSANNYLLS